MKDIDEIFKLLESEKLEPEYLDVDEYGFSRHIKFKTKYQTCYISWWANIATLSVGERYGLRVPFTDVNVNTTSPSNRRSLMFTHSAVQKHLGETLEDVDTELTLEKLDWQENK